MFGTVCLKMRYFFNVTIICLYVCPADTVISCQFFFLAKKKKKKVYENYENFQRKTIFLVEHFHRNLLMGKIYSIVIFPPEKFETIFLLKFFAGKMFRWKTLLEFLVSRRNCSHRKLPEFWFPPENWKLYL